MGTVHNPVHIPGENSRPVINWKVNITSMSVNRKNNTPPPYLYFSTGSENGWLKECGRDFHPCQPSPIPLPQGRQDGHYSY